MDFLKEFGEDDYYDKMQLFGFMNINIMYTYKQLKDSVNYSKSCWEAVSNGESLYWIKYYINLEKNLQLLLDRYCLYDGIFYKRPKNNTVKINKIKPIAESNLYMSTTINNNSKIEESLLPYKLPDISKNSLYIKRKNTYRKKILLSMKK